MAKKTTKPPAPGVTRRRDWKALFLANLARMGIVKLAAEAAGVSRKTVYDHRENDEAFAAKWEEAMEDAADVLEAEAWRRAHDGLLQKKFTKGGEPIIDPATGEQYVERTYDTPLITLLLKARRPEKFRDNQHVTHAGDMHIKTTDEGEAEAVAILASLRERFGAVGGGPATD